MPTGTTGSTGARFEPSISTMSFFTHWLANVESFFRTARPETNLGLFGAYEGVILLMVQKSHSQPPGVWMYKTLLKSWDKLPNLPTSTGERRISEPSTVLLTSTHYSVLWTITINHYKCPYPSITENTILANISRGDKKSTTKLNISRWWFQILFIFTPIWGRFPI